jgi:hypothetical protein
VVRSAATHTTTTTATNAREVMAAELAAFAAELHRAARQAAHERRQLELELKSRQLELTRVEALHARGAVLGMRHAGARAVLGAEDVGQLLEAAATLAPTAALAVRRLAVSLACAASVVAIRRRAASVSPADPPAVYALYMELWKYFYGAYLCLPFAR